ncbi:hypothetical protein FH608_027415 [Nonomuraea phyllanthi]|uniref:Uncharacterized protein n=1 Tax=Nonomuraea phyllanthi TaxID=2219224 RepID=A0A5C4W6Z1_9ACTN|nr:hypothetical protein [Nonomuraea phyllanthi]KAB8192386.1 hypothetical protein FH608_027415 [Nonomuraea phyllanthi]
MVDSGIYGPGGKWEEINRPYRPDNSGGGGGCGGCLTGILIMYGMALFVIWLSSGAPLPW